MGERVVAEQDARTLETLVWRLRIVAVGIILAVFARLSGIFLELSAPSVRAASDQLFGGLLPEALSIFSFWLILCVAYLWSRLTSAVKLQTERSIGIAFDVSFPLLICLYFFSFGSQGAESTERAAEIGMTAYFVFILIFIRPLALLSVIKQRLQARL